MIVHIALLPGPLWKGLEEPKSKPMRSRIWQVSGLSAFVLVCGLGLTMATPVRAAAITSMQIVAVKKNQFSEIVWPWPATAVRILTLDEGTQGKVAGVIITGDAAGIEFSLSSCLIRPPALACTPSASTTPCCIFSSPKLPTEIDRIADRAVPPGNYMVYLAAPGSSLKQQQRAPPAKVHMQQRRR